MDPKEEEFREEEKTQEEEDDMEVDIEEDDNESVLTYLYEEVDPLNPLLHASDSELEDVNEVENTLESEDETVPVIIHETAHALVKKKGKAKDEYYGKLILDLSNEVRSSLEQGTATMEKLVEKLGNDKDKAECKKLKKELKVARVDHQSHEDLLVILSSLVLIMSAPLTQAAIRRMIKESVDAAIAAERARHENAGNDARGSGPARGQDAAPIVRECTFTGFMKCNPTAFHGPALTWWNAKVATMSLETMNQMPWTEMKQLMTAKFYTIEEVQKIEHKLLNLKVKEYNTVTYTQRFNELALMCPRMVESE
nr:hypothetical protein [Tanacetum cinerariifolium]